jgi:putative endonuclease
MNTKESGARGEDTAVAYLQSKGYRILERNYRSRYGEIDIIAESAPYIVFVEVKARKSGAVVPGREAVDRRKQKKILQTAMLYLERYPSPFQPRFDVVELEYGERGFRVVHLEHAFWLEDGGHGIF